MNKIQIIGNLVRDPETRSVSGYNGDTQVCSFTVAANGRRRSNQNNQNGQQQDDTLFIRVSVWGTRADVCQRYLAKGNKVFVTGDLQQPRTYQDQSGNTRVSLEMRADDFEFLTSRAEAEAMRQNGGMSASPAAPAAPTAQNNGFTAVESDDLPF